MLFSPAAYMNYYELQKAYKNQPLEGFSATELSQSAGLATAFSIFIILLIVDILFLIFAIHFALKCSKKNNWPSWVLFLLIVSFFIPFVGGATSLGVIIYGLLVCK